MPSQESLGQRIRSHMLTTHRRSLTRPLVAERAASMSFVDWASRGGFKADARDTIDFSAWRYLHEIYGAVPQDLTNFDLTIMKPTQAGASIFAMLWALWMALRTVCHLGYFLPVANTAIEFSRDRFVKLVRANRAIHRMMGEQVGGRRRAGDEGNVGVRKFGESNLYFTYMGGKVTTEARPLDAVVLDEVQEMILGDIQKVEERLSGSRIKAKLRVSTANFEGADIAHFYARSDQREFHTRCGCPSGVVLADCWDPELGPTCIESVGGEVFYVCPKCRTRILDPQDGTFIAHAPENAPRIGFHWAQMLSPYQTAASILQKWVDRADTATFYRRILGRPYTDPKTVPVTDDLLKAAEAKGIQEGLQWGPLSKKDTDGVFVGIDQMQHVHYVVVLARVGTSNIPRLIWLEVIQDADPWKRLADLFGEFRMRFAALEALPNTDPAYQIANAHPGRVFVVDAYSDMQNNVLKWGDHPSETSTERRTADEFKTPFTVTVDQYKMMALALGRFRRGEFIMPDSRGRTQAMRTDKGVREVALCRELFWLHMQRVALVTELPEGREDERKPRRAVKKIGIDPHFAYALMLANVAWARAYGTTIFLNDDLTATEANAMRPKPPTTPIEDVRQRLNLPAPPTTSCADCAQFDGERGFCTARELYTAADAPSCEDLFIPNPEDEP